MRVTGDHLEGVLHPQFAKTDAPVIATGLAASPGAAVGQAYFTADDAAAAAERGEQVMLVRTETSPEDVHGMIVGRGHPHVPGRAGEPRRRRRPGMGQARGRGRGVDPDRRQAASPPAGVTVREGDAISVDGTTGKVMLGEVPVTLAEPPPEFTTLLTWADEIRAGKMAVRANADTGPDAANARQFGAEGIGLCRTEHMFLGDRLPVVRAHDHGRDAGGGDGRPRAAAPGPEGRLPRGAGGDGRPAGHRAPPRPAPARVPAPHRGPAGEAGRRHGADAPRSSASSRRPSTGTSSTPCSAPGASAWAW